MNPIPFISKRVSGVQKALHDVEYDVIYLSTGASDKSWILLFQTLATHTHSCILYRAMEDAEVAA